MYKLPTTFECN